MEIHWPFFVFDQCLMLLSLLGLAGIFLTGVEWVKFWRNQTRVECIIARAIAQQARKSQQNAKILHLAACNFASRDSIKNKYYNIAFDFLCRSSENLSKRDQGEVWKFLRATPKDAQERFVHRSFIRAQKLERLL